MGVKLPIPGSIPSEGEQKPTVQTPQPEDVERFYLNQLERANQEAFVHLQAMSRPESGLTPEEIVSILNYLYSTDQYFLRYGPIAQQLLTSGLPSLSVRLSQITSDIENTMRIYGDMYRSGMTVRTNWAAIQADTAAQAQQNMLQALQSSERMWNRWAAENNDLNEHTISVHVYPGT